MYVRYCLLVCIFVFKVVSYFEHFSLDEIRVCLCVCLCVCVSLASDSSETIEVIIIKLGTANAPYMLMHHV